MPETILQPKLYIPPPPAPGASVLRPRLSAILDSSLRRPAGVTLISAPAGFGKTTLVSDWIANLRPASDDLRLDTAKENQIVNRKPKIVNRVAWLSLDRDDNDPVRFLSYFVAALRTLSGDLGSRVLSMLQSPQPPPVEALLTPLVNEIASLPQKIIFVLDDYQVIEARPIHEALAFLLEHLPPPMHLVLISRADPPLPLARLRGRGILTELRVDDLRFTPAEAAEFLNNKTGLRLSPEELTSLDRRLEGWIVGLELAALSLRGRSPADSRDFLAALSGNDRYIADYLVEEVLQHQPAGVQTFLRRTSILDRLCDSLCNAVTERDDGQAVLERLERSNLFIMPLDNKRRWYRYHPLFAELLRRRLRQSEPELVPELYRRASRWYERNGWTNEAINAALLGRDAAGAARLVAARAGTLLKRGEITTLARWLAELPEEMVRADPSLCLALAWTRMILGPVEALEPSLQQAETAIAGLADEASAGRRALMAEVKALRAISTIEQGDTSPAAIDFAARAWAALPRENGFLYSSLATTLGIAHRANGGVAAALDSFQAARSVAEQSDNLLSLLVVSYELAELELDRGRLGRAETLHRQALAQAETQLGPGIRHIPLAGAAHIGLGKLFYEWNDLAAAREQLERGNELANQKGSMGLSRESALALAFLCQAERDQAAESWMERAEMLARSAPRDEIKTRVQLYRVRLWLRQQRLAEARRWAEANDLDIEATPDYAGEMAYLTLVRVYLALNERPLLQPAVKVLAHLLERAEGQDRLGRAIEISLLQALVYHRLGQAGRAIDGLARSLNLAEPEGYVRLFVDEGPLLVELLQPALARQIAPAAYTRRLLAAGQAELVKEAARAGAQPLVEPLTERELEVLSLIAAGLSNKAIAQTLVITVGTVKRHTMNIYGKLGVNSRTQAVGKGRELGLVE